MKTINDMTLSDLMAEDLNIHMCPEKFGFDLTIENDNGILLMHETGVHPEAAESFADFCVRYLVAFEQAKRMPK
jgi:hypothetical protein